MKNCLIGFCMAICFLGVPAKGLSQAYDASYSNPCACVPPFNGFYIGGNGGFVSYTSDRTDLDQFIATSNISRTVTDWVGGVQLGHDWLMCFRLFGVVADWEWTNAHAKIFLEPNINPTADDRITSRMRWFTTIRARAGIMLEDLLVYVTGGAAVSEIHTKIQRGASGAILIPQKENFNKTRWGWAAGFGADYFVGGQWSIQAEVLYLHFASTSVTFFDAAEERNTKFNFYDTAWVGKIALNYHFCLCGEW